MSLNKAVRLGVSAALLGWVVWKTNWGQVGDAFRHFRPELWLAAIGTLTLTQMASALRWQMLARPLGFQRSLWQYTGIYFIGMYFNLVLPTSVGGDVVRAWYLDGRSGRRLAAFVAVFLDRLSGLLVLLSMACVATALCPLELPAWIPWSVWGTAGCAVAGLALLPVVARWSKRARIRAEQLRSAFAALRQPHIVVSTTLLSLVVQAANVLIVWLVGTAIGAGVPAAYYWILVPMISLLTLLPISVNGMGLREKGMALFLAPLGIGEGTALTLSLLWFAVFSATSLAGGFVYVFGRFPRLSEKGDCPPKKRGQSPFSDAASGKGSDDGSVGGDSDQGREGQLKTAA